MTTYTTSQLQAQRTSLMTTIKLMENELSENAIDTLYNKVIAIGKELETEKI